MPRFFEDRNRRAWDDRVETGQSHTEPVTRRELANALATLDDCGWLGGSIQGQRVLCLAAGGGKHSILCAAAGAVVTVVDLSPRMLELDRRLAQEHGYQVRTVEASMQSLPMLGAASFDLVLQPVSTCYVPEVLPVYREVARVLRAGGLYISQHKQPACLQASVRPVEQGGYVLSEPYYRQGPLPEVFPGCFHREAGTTEFLHRWDELIGGLCRSGFVLEDLREPGHGDPAAEPATFRHRSAFVPPFVTLKARRLEEGGGASAGGGARIWIP